MHESTRVTLGGYRPPGAASENRFVTPGAAIMGPMPAEPDVRTERGFDRFVNFSDAVVAIAISLLILPLVDAANDSIEPGTSALDFVRDNGDRLFAFGLSFLVIASYWVAHHAMFEEVRSYSKPLMW